MAADFDINAHLQNMRFGQQQSGSSDSSGGADTYESLVQKGVDKTVQNVAKLTLGWIGIHINTDIEGKSALAGFDPQNVGSGLSLTNMAMVRPESGGGWLSMLLDIVKKYFTRDLPSAVAANIDSGGGGAGGGSGGDGGGSDGFAGNSNTMMAGGGGDFQAPSMGGGGGDISEPQVNYGGRMVAADTLISDLGNLRPSATPVGDGANRGGGMDMGV